MGVFKITCLKMHTGKQSLASDCPCSGISRLWYDVGCKSLLLAMLPFSFNQEWRKRRTEKGRVENESWVKREHLGSEVWEADIASSRPSRSFGIWDKMCLSDTIGTDCIPAFLVSLSFYWNITVLKRLLFLTAFAVAHQIKPCWGVANGTLEKVECSWWLLNPLLCLSLSLCFCRANISSSLSFHFAFILSYLFTLRLW